MLVDSHCHLDFPELVVQLPDLVTRADDAGVKLMVTISTHVRKFDKILQVAEQYENIYCTVGTHPHNAAEEPDVTAEELIKLAEHPKVVAIGEVGLDYHYDNSPREAQAAGFRVHIEAARQTGLPLVIHSRDAEEDTAQILEEEMAKGAFKPLLHCFSSKPELARRAVALGAYVSFSGILTFKNAENIRIAAEETPMSRVLVETDAPYLAPNPHRGQTNEPALVVHTAAKLAEVKGVSETEIAKATTENFFRLFSKVPAAEFAL